MSQNEQINSRKARLCPSRLTLKHNWKKVTKSKVEWFRLGNFRDVSQGDIFVIKYFRIMRSNGLICEF